MFGCSDPRALNFIPATSSNVTNGSVQHTVPTRAISPTQFATYSVDMLSLPSGIQCVYEASVDGVNETTTCPSANDGRCDEPLHCLPLISQLPPTIAEALVAGLVAGLVDGEARWRGVGVCGTVHAAASPPPTEKEPHPAAPASHATQAVALGDGWYSPATQSAHTLSPLAFEALPGAHAIGVAERARH